MSSDHNVPRHQRRLADGRIPGDISLVGIDGLDDSKKSRRPLLLGILVVVAVAGLAASLLLRAPGYVEPENRATEFLALVPLTSLQQTEDGWVGVAEPGWTGIYDAKQAAVACQILVKKLAVERSVLVLDPTGKPIAECGPAVAP